MPQFFFVLAIFKHPVFVQFVSWLKTDIRELRKGNIETLTNCDIKRIRKNIYQARRGVLPKLPAIQEEVHHALNSHPIKTNRDELFLLVKDAENKIIMLMSKKFKIFMFLKIYTVCP
jgi:hypothetical protein